MKLNFKNLKMYVGISQKIEVVHDSREEFADVIFINSTGIQSLELARKIYNSDGESEYTEREVDLIRRCAELCTPQCIVAINNMIDNAKQ